MFSHRQIAREGQWKVSIENVTDETGVLSIVGPNARDLLADAVGDKDLVKNWKFLDAKQVWLVLVLIGRSILETEKGLNLCFQGVSLYCN